MSVFFINNVLFFTLIYFWLPSIQAETRPLSQAPKETTQLPDSEAESDQYIHEHGKARLTIALEEEKLEISLESPAANLFGFEHPSATSDDKKKVAAAIDKLRDENRLFKLEKSAKCEFAGVEITAAEIASQKSNQDVETVHKDIDASWVYECKKPEKIKQIKTRFFSVFPKGFKQIEVEWIMPQDNDVKIIEKDQTIKLQTAS